MINLTTPKPLQTSLIDLVSTIDMDRRRNWYVFRTFNLYRLVLVLILLGIYLIGNQHRFLGAAHPQLFMWTAITYLAIVLVSLAGSFRRLPILSIQIHTQSLVDIIGLSLLSYASGGVTIAFGILLITAVASSGILLPMLSTLLAAALACLMLLGLELLRAWQSFSALDGRPSFTLDGLGEFLIYALQSMDMVQLTILGAALATAGMITCSLAERVRRSEALAGLRSQELLELAQLNQIIVQHLQSGIIVVDRFARVRFMNDTAHQLLNYQGPERDVPLSEISPLLSQRLATWLSISMHNPRPFRQEEHLPDITPNFTYLSDHGQSGDTLIFLEDSSKASQRLQQIKLAALGRLTASIAHEVRNPLASISHAAQLLHESETSSPGDKRLANIIYDNAKRANTIIANVLDLSRRDKAKPENFELKVWLEDFRQEFLRGYNKQTPEIEIQVHPENLRVRFDSGHLQQVLWNLFTNACVHGAVPGVTPTINIIVGLDSNTAKARPILDVIDTGLGVPETERQRIFEPFFTTKSQGTGLGLYISREICEANRGQLQYIRRDDLGSCFRITFPAASRVQKKKPLVSVMR